MSMMVAVRNAIVEDDFHGEVRLKKGVSYVSEAHEIVSRHPHLFKPAEGARAAMDRERVATVRDGERIATTRVTPARPNGSPPAHLSYTQLQAARRPWHLRRPSVRPAPEIKLRDSVGRVAVVIGPVAKEALRLAALATPGVETAGLLFTHDLATWKPVRLSEVSTAGVLAKSEPDRHRVDAFHDRRV